MEGDFTRGSDDRQDRYSGVLMQQGRVQLDADWNEQWLIQTQALRESLRDLIGRHGGPSNDLGFGIGSQGDDPRTLALGTGVYYVDGIRCVQRDPGATLSIPSDAGNYLVFLDVWERHVNAIEDPRIREVALLGPDTATRAQVVWRVRFLSFTNNVPQWETGDAVAEPLIETMQQRRRRRLAARANTVNTSADPCMLSPLAQYRGLENQLYRVQIHDAWPSAGRPPVVVKPQVVKPAGKETAREKAERERAEREKAERDKLEAESGEPTLFTFKWSRDNGSVVFPIVNPVHVGSPESNETAGDGEIVVTVKLAQLGRDERYGLVANDIVELVHDAATLETLDDTVLTDGGRDPGRPGLLGRVLSPIDLDDLTVRIAVYAEDIADIPEGTLHPYLRRWDQRSTAERKLERGAIAVKRSQLDKWLPLEDGVEVLFESGIDGNANGEVQQRAGDYWLIPARTVTGDVLWPTEPSVTGQPPRPVRVAPHGPYHHYAPLGIVGWSGSSVTVGPIGVRKKFRPLAYDENMG